MLFAFSVAFQTVMSSCLVDLDGGRSLQLKNLLSDYFDKRRDRERTLQPVDLEELDKYKVISNLPRKCVASV